MRGVTRARGRASRAARWAACVAALGAVDARAQAPEPSGESAEGLEQIDSIEEVSLEGLLEGVVVTASRTEERVEEAPARVTVLTRHEIEWWGWQSVAEALRHVLGFYLVEDHVIPNVAVRGVSAGLRGESGLIKVMIDGRPVSFRSTAGNWLDAELVPLSAVERIEIVLGPASAIYGADAFLGVVNVITRTGEDVNGGDLTVAGSYGGGPGGGIDLAAGGRRGGLDVLLAGRLARTDLSGLPLPASSPRPRIPSYRTGERTTRDLDQLSHVGMLALRHALDDRTRASATLWVSQLERGAELADWAQLGSGVDSQGRRRGSRIALVQGLLALRFERSLSDEVDFTFDYQLFAGGPTDADRIDVGSDIFEVRRALGFRGYALATTLTVTPSREWTINGGVDFVYDDEQLPSVLHVLSADAGALRAGDVREGTSTRQGRRLFLNPGAYAHATWRLVPDRLSLAAGLRFDYHNIYGSQVSGRAGAVVSPVDGVYAKLLYGSAFRAPSPLLLHGVPVAPGDIIGNASLAPQYVHVVEAEVSWLPVRELRIATALAYGYLQNKAEFALVGNNEVARNLSELASISWETSAQLVLPSFRAYLGVAVQEVIRNEGEAGYRAELLGSGLLAYPPVIAHAGALWRLPELPLRLGIEASFFAPVRASDINALERGEVYELDAAFDLGATLSTVGLQLLPDRETNLSVVGRNLLGLANATPGFAGVDYPGRPRTVMLVLRQEL